MTFKIGSGTQNIQLRFLSRSPAEYKFAYPTNLKILSRSRNIFLSSFFYVKDMICLRVLVLLRQSRGTQITYFSEIQNPQDTQDRSQDKHKFCRAAAPPHGAPSWPLALGSWLAWSIVESWRTALSRGRSKMTYATKTLIYRNLQFCTTKIDPVLQNDIQIFSDKSDQ